MAAATTAAIIGAVAGVGSAAAAHEQGRVMKRQAKKQREAAGAEQAKFEKEAKEKADAENMQKQNFAMAQQAKRTRRAARRSSAASSAASTTAPQSNDGAKTLLGQ